jgi:membrane protease YdiL (CAAX protease family)
VSEPQNDGGAPKGFGGAVGIAPGAWGVNRILIALFVAVGAVLIGIGIVSAFDPDLESEGASLAAQGVVALSLIGVAVGFARASSPGGPFSSLGFRRAGWAAIGLAFAAWFGYVIVAAQIAPLLQPEQQDVTRNLGVDEGTLSLVIAGFLIVVAAPFSEEIFFRGFMFAGLRRRIPLWPAAAVSAAFWGLLHLSGGNFGVAAQLTIFGLLLAWLYEQTGSLWPPIVAHAFNNALAFTLLVTDTI